ncbi:MAG: DEAD/DEAH box helicase [Defluviitaleaceae bacterium]|nr:DEAD/DEAH box helicase [Defluviitaleaceae bacterium]
MKAIAIYAENGFITDTIKDNDEYQSEFHTDFFKQKYEALYEHAFLEKSGYDVSIQFLIDIAKAVIRDVSGSPDVDFSRVAPEPDSENLMQLMRLAPYVTGCEFINLNWIRQIYSKITDVFNAQFAKFPGSLEEYIKSKNALLNVAGRVFFHLVENKTEDYPFAFLATYSEGKTEDVKHVPLKNVLESKNKNENLQEKLLHLLSAVSRAAEKSEFISDLIESGELFSPLRFTSQEAYTFLKETPVYEESGVICRIPNFWKRKAGARLKASVGSKEPAALGMDALMAFSPSIFLGDEEFTREEIERLISESHGLAFLKNKWVEVDPEKLQSLLKAFDEINGKELSFADAIRMQSGLMPLDENTEDEIEVTNSEWLNELRSKMTNPSKIKKQNPSKTFTATLREYQNAGFNWLNFMKGSGFGALLADDMGLGKTVQILALLDFLRKDKIKTLLVIPASLIENWKKEASRFTPKLNVKIIHGTEKDFEESEADLFITTYGMVARLEQLTEKTWDLFILDEAQAIKNHSNKQTTAVKKIQAKSKIAMTGTPVENRLSDLWSIFDFLNKGLLGTQKEFTTFTKNLRDDRQGYEKLRRAVSPFILRRLKTDKSIINDLPDKAEIKQFTTLTKKQIVLYNRLVNDLEQAMELEMPGIQRKGLILSSIMKFKQICNHPDQYLGNKEFSPKLSGKFETLADICETIRDKRERVLVFTQFKEMTKPIADFLEELFGREGMILHGGTTVKKRGELVENFNDPEKYVPFMVLSLKAGGVGLNLTAANHVIHFDRWWNPAIENQATDRAFRIGQQKNVCVHKFVTTGTIEEKIDTIIEEKQKLSADVISEKSGEGWLTEMKNEELFDLFRLEV